MLTGCLVDTNDCNTTMSVVSGSPCVIASNQASITPLTCLQADAALVVDELCRSKMGGRPWRA